MKKFFINPLYLGVIVCMALAGCQNPLDPPEKAALPQGRGRVAVNIGTSAANGAARTIGPLTTAFSKYELAFAGPELMDPVEATPGTETEVELPIGDWTITATGYGSNEAEVARGSADVAVTSGDIGEVEIILSPLTVDSPGIFKYTVLHNSPVGYNLMRLPFTLAISTAAGEAVETISLTMGTFSHQYNSGNRSLAPGEYLAQIQAGYYGGTTAKYVGLTEVFHIYSGLETEFYHAFTDDDSQETVTQFDLTSLVTAPVAWETPDETFGANNQYATAGASGLLPNASLTTVSWLEADGSTPVEDIFATNTVYKARVALAPASGYTFMGVPQNSFIYTGAQVVNAANSGELTITFPATANHSIDDVTVSPASPSVAQGDQAQFSAVVTGTAAGGGAITPPQTVSWSVSGNLSEQTSIATDGLLTIALAETATSLTVKASSAMDTSVYGEATVTVTKLVTGHEPEEGEVSIFTDGPGADTTLGTLRYTLTNAQAGDTITFFGVTPGETTITLQSPLPQITVSLTIEGNGITLTPSEQWTASATSQLLYNNSTEAVTIRRVHFKNGLGEARGAAIYSKGALTLESCIFSGNKGTTYGTMYLSGTNLIVRGCTFFNNGPASASGAAIFKTSGQGHSLTMTGNLFYKNTATSVRQVVAVSGMTVTASYNVVDVAFGSSGTGNTKNSGWDAGTGDKTTLNDADDLTIEGDPFDTTTFVPVSGLESFLPSGLTDFPATDFYGTTRSFPGAPGAVAVAPGS
jgi:hypothetical protein